MEFSFRNFGFALGLAIGLVMVFPTLSYAFEGLDNVPSLSYKLSRPKEEIYKDMEVHHEVPFNDPLLSMEFKLPTGWIKYEDKFNAEKLSVKEESESEKGSDIFKPLVRYISPPRLEWRSEFRVRSIEMDGLISLKDWFAIYMLQMGLSAEGLSVISENRIDTQYTLFEKGEPTTIRAVIERSGNRIILAEYLVHEDNYALERDQQVAAMASYVLLNPDRSVPVDMNTYAFVDIAKFRYPENWILVAPDIDTIDRMEASVINLRGLVNSEGVDVRTYQLNGRIDVTMVSKFIGTNVETEVALVGEELRKNGLVLGDKVEDVKGIKTYSLIESSEISIYHIAPPEGEVKRYERFSSKAFRAKENNKLADYEYWLAILQTKGRIYLVRLLTIGRDEDFRAWAENTETFRLLISSISPVNDDVH